VSSCCHLHPSSSSIPIYASINHPTRSLSGRASPLSRHQAASYILGGYSISYNHQFTNKAIFATMHFLIIFIMFLPFIHTLPSISSRISLSRFKTADKSQSSSGEQGLGRRVSVQVAPLDYVSHEEGIRAMQEEKRPFARIKSLWAKHNSKYSWSCFGANTDEPVSEEEWMQPNQWLKSNRH